MPVNSSDPTRLRRQHAGLFVTVRSIDLRGAPVADLASLGDLVEVARRQDTVVLELTDELGADYLIWDDGIVFRFRHGPEMPPNSDLAPGPRAGTDRRAVIERLRQGNRPE
jgi:hypothetical protein